MNATKTVLKVTVIFQWEVIVWLKDGQNKVDRQR